MSIRGPQMRNQTRLRPRSMKKASHVSGLIESALPRLMNTLHRTLTGSPNKRERLYQLQLETATDFRRLCQSSQESEKKTPEEPIFSA